MDSGSEQPIRNGSLTKIQLADKRPTLREDHVENAAALFGSNSRSSCFPGADLFAAFLGATKIDFAKRNCRTVKSKTKFTSSSTYGSDLALPYDRLVSSTLDGRIKDATNRLVHSSRVSGLRRCQYSLQKRPPTIYFYNPSSTRGKANPHGCLLGQFPCFFALG